MQKLLAAGKIILVNLVIVLLLVLSVEGLVRWVFPEIIDMGEDAQLFQMNKFGKTYGYKANVRGISFGVPVVTDDRGFRIDPTQPPKKKKKNILLVGDSVSAGIGVDAAAAYPYVLDRKLSNHNIINASVSGYSFHDYVNVISALSREINLEGVIIGVCLNDFDIASQQNIVALARKKYIYPGKILGTLRYISDNYIDFNAILRRYSRSYLLIKSLAADTSKNHFLAEKAIYERPLHFQQVADALKLLCNVTGNNGWVLLYILPFEYQLRAGSEDNLLPQKLIIKAAHDNNLMVSDPYPKIRQYLSGKQLPANSLYVYDDPCHFSLAGHKLIADLLYQELLVYNLISHP